MFKTTLRVSEATDVESVIADLRANCESAGIGPVVTELITAQTREILFSLVERGKQLAAMGSQMQVTREISGEGYFVKVIFGAGIRRGFLQRVKDAVRGG